MTNFQTPRLAPVLAALKIPTVNSKQISAGTYASRATFSTLPLVFNRKKNELKEFESKEQRGNPGGYALLFPCCGAVLDDTASQ